MRMGSVALVGLALALAGCTKTRPSETTKTNLRVSHAATELPAVASVSQVAGASALADTAQQKTVAAEKVEGPFQLGDTTYTFVKHVLSIDRQPHSPDDETVDWWEIRDANGAAAYRKSYGDPKFQNGTFEETTSVGAQVLKTRFGKGLLVGGMDLPSAPNSGSWVQVFGVVNGKLVPFGPEIATDGEFESEAIDSFTPSVIFRSASPQPQRVERDVLNFKVWTGDFSIIYPVLVDWLSGKVGPAWRCLRSTPKGQVERCRYKIVIEPHRAQTETFVRLFQEPEEGFGTPAHVVIRPESKIEHIEAEVPVEWAEQNDSIFINGEGGGNDIWLHVKIDGQDGWIHTEEDFNAIGLQQSG